MSIIQNDKSSGSWKMERKRKRSILQVLFIILHAANEHGRWVFLSGNAPHSSNTQWPTHITIYISSCPCHQWACILFIHSYILAQMDALSIAPWVITRYQNILRPKVVLPFPPHLNFGLVECNICVRKTDSFSCRFGCERNYINYLR